MMKHVLALAAIVVGAFLGIVFIQYGSLDPCEMLKTDMVRGATNAGDDPLLAAAYVESIPLNLTPAKCIDQLWRLHNVGL